MGITTLKLQAASHRVQHKDQITTLISEQDIGLKIRSLRRAAGMSLRELGDAIGVSLVQLQRYETCASQLSIARLLAISTVLGVPVSSLFGESAAAEPERLGNMFHQEGLELSRLFASLSEPVNRRTILYLVRTAAARENLVHTRAETTPLNETHDFDPIQNELER